MWYMMSKIPGLSSIRGSEGGLAPDPRESMSFWDDPEEGGFDAGGHQRQTPVELEASIDADMASNPEVVKLFEDARAGRLPRRRELKSWEPQVLNRRHLALISMKAAGFKNKELCAAFEATPSNVSVVLRHPDAEYILDRLQALRAAAPKSIEQRLQALSERAVETLEELFDPMSEVKIEKKAPAAFKLLERNGFGARKEATVTHRFEATGEQLQNLSSALREAQRAREIPVARYEVAEGEALPMLGSGNEHGDLPPSELPSGAAASSSGDSQIQAPAPRTIAELRSRPSPLKVESRPPDWEIE